MNRNIIKLATLLVSLLVFFACSGGDSSGSSKKKPIANTTTAFTLSSSEFTNGGVIPAHSGMTMSGTCGTAKVGANNQSPVLSWTNPPAGTRSFVIVLKDEDAPNFAHWAIWDMPAATTNLRAAAGTTANRRPVGAVQAGFTNGAADYHGMCPPNGMAAHTYEFKVHAMDIAALAPGGVQYPNVTAALAGNKMGNILGTATLKGTFTIP